MIVTTILPPIIHSNIHGNDNITDKVSTLNGLGQLLVLALTSPNPNASVCGVRADDYIKDGRNLCDFPASPRVNFFIWLVLHGRVKTFEFLHSFNLYLETFVSCVASRMRTLITFLFIAIEFK